MKRSTFLLIVAILSFAFGILNFFAPAFGAGLFGLDQTITTLTVLRGMGGLLIGSACINLLMRNIADEKAIAALLVANMVTHALGLLADIWGVNDGALTVMKIVPVELAHLFAGVGSAFYFFNRKSNEGTESRLE